MPSAKKQKVHTLNKFISGADSFVGRSIHISKIVQGTHQQGIFVMDLSNAYASH